LPPCPKPDYSKKTDVERFAKWTKCWGRYRVELDKDHKGDVLEGEWLNGSLHGQGAYTAANGDKYVGEYKDGKQHGQGTATFASGDKYVGEYKNDKKNGQGTYTWADGDKYVGEWKDGKMHGQGTNTWADGDKYVGEFKDDKKNGQGTYTAANGDKYVGEFKDDKKNGQGTATFASGDKYVGEFKDDKRNGQGTATFASGDKYVGEYKDGKYHGQGTYTFGSGDKYVGENKDGKRHGLGIMTLANGSWHYGEWQNNMPHGQGIRFSPISGEREEGIWADGNFIRAAKVNLPAMNTNIVANTNRTDIDRERQQLAEERKRLEEEKRQREQAKASSRINLQVSASTPTSNGAYTISIQTNADTASLKINGEEIGGRADGRYTVNRIARAGQDTKLDIVATDIYNNSDTKTITVARPALPSSAQTAILKPETIKIVPTRDAVAIIIGIQNYKRVPKAEFANNDAREFNEYAIRALGIKPEKIKMLLDDEADEVNIFKAFENWLPIQVNKDKTDVYVFYSGHGLPAPDGKSLYFLPHGVDKELLSRTAVAQNEIVAALTAAKPKSVTMFIDACYSGQTRGGDVLIPNEKPVVPKLEANPFPANFTVITASANDQTSLSSPELKHGIFSFYLMKGMEGDADTNQDGKITVGEMQDYLSDKVARQATTLGRKQNTQVVGDAGRVLVAR
jgi:hypothetical protein